MTEISLQTRRPPGRASLIAAYSAPTPRYTSYPTAVQFTPQVNAATYARWLAALDPAAPVSLYIHIPFCTRLCWYCGCNTRAVNRREPVEAYVRELTQELALLEPVLPGRLRVQSLHLGGGSPNLLSADDLAGLFDALGHVFRLDADLQVSAELDPGTLDEGFVRALSYHGLTRASLGVQNLSPQVQAAVNRVESPDNVRQAMGWLRRAGVKSINLDLMYGLPHQTPANTLATLDEILPLKPDRLAVFGYAHVPRMKPHQRLIPEEALPGPAARLQQFEAVSARLLAEGYVALGLDHFALPTDSMALAARTGRLRRDFQGYTTEPPGTLLGLGASAIGRLPQGYVQSHAQDLTWRTALAHGELPVARGVAFTPEDLFRGDIIERLMCDLAVDLAEVCRAHRRDLVELDREIRSLDSFVRDGLLERDGPRVRVTAEGRLFIRSICAAFDVYFAPELGRHSKGV